MRAGAVLALVMLSAAAACPTGGGAAQPVGEVAAGTAEGGMFIKPIVHIAAPEGALHELVEALAQALKGRGTVYTPHPVVPPNARVAVPPPRDAFVALADPAAASTLNEVIRGHLDRGTLREVRLETASGALTLRAGEPVGADALRAALALD